MVDKEYCMSSYLAFRYIERDDVDFYAGIHHNNMKLIPLSERIAVKTSKDIDNEIKKQIAQFEGKKKGILLSGGMDSAIVASYLRGTDAYTFRFLGGTYQNEELERARYYSNYYGLTLHYVDIDWRTVERYLDIVMKAKAAPVHSIEPQIFQAALQAKEDGIEVMFIGESSDLVFGGMDGLLSKDWMFDEFVTRYMFTNPADILVNPKSVLDVFERYRTEGEGIDFLSFMDDIFAVESSGSYYNSFSAAGMPYYDPYAKLVMADKLDLNRVRNGESKYLIRELMAQKYPDIIIPEKVPMPRPVDLYFDDWKGPNRKEFRGDINVKDLTGNQKWQLFCLERFLDINEGKCN